MKKILLHFGRLLSFLYTTKINKVIQKIFNYIYTGWISRNFKEFDGLVEGRISINNPHCISVGRNTVIGNNVRLWAYEKFNNQNFSPEIVIGEESAIFSDCFISAANKIVIGDRVAVTEHTIILDNIHGDFQDNHLQFSDNPDVPDVFLQNAFNRPLASKGPVVIENDVHIGMFCTILPGTVIGHHSVIAAHSVVSRKIPPYSLVAGNPAEIILTFGRKKKTT